jgi:hypothetical protein
MLEAWRSSVTAVCRNQLGCPLHCYVEGWGLARSVMFRRRTFSCLIGDVIRYDNIKQGVTGSCAFFVNLIIIFCFPLDMEIFQCVHVFHLLGHMKQFHNTHNRVYGAITVQQMLCEVRSLICIFEITVMFFIAVIKWLPVWPVYFLWQSGRWSWYIPLSSYTSCLACWLLRRFSMVFLVLYDICSPVFLTNLWYISFVFLCM